MTAPHTNPSMDPDSSSEGRRSDGASLQTSAGNLHAAQRGSEAMVDSLGHCAGVGLLPLLPHN